MINDEWFGWMNQNFIWLIMEYGYYMDDNIFGWSKQRV